MSGCGPLPERCPSVFVDTEKVLREGDGSHEAGRGKTAHGWKGVRLQVRLESPSGEPVRSPKNTSAMSTSGSLEPMILSRIMPTYSLLVSEMTIFRNSTQSGTEYYCL